MVGRLHLAMPCSPTETGGRARAVEGTVVVPEHLRIAHARHSKARQTVTRRSRVDPAELEVAEVAHLRDAVLGRELVLFASWGEVQNYAAYDPVGGNLQPFVDLVDTHGPEAILTAVDKLTDEGDADVTVSTAHKAKDREWPTVRIVDDFHPQGH